MGATGHRSGYRREMAGVKRWFEMGQTGGRMGQQAGGHPLALVEVQQPFNPEVFAKEEAKMKRKKLQPLHNIAAALNYSLVPNQ
jgi:hypothetical protein